MFLYFLLSFYVVYFNSLAFGIAMPYSNLSIGIYQYLYGMLTKLFIALKLIFFVSFRFDSSREKVINENERKKQNETKPRETYFVRKTDWKDLFWQSLLSKIEYMLTHAFDKQNARIKSYVIWLIKLENCFATKKQTFWFIWIVKNENKSFFDCVISYIIELVEFAARTCYTYFTLICKQFLFQVNFFFRLLP